MSKHYVSLILCWPAGRVSASGSSNHLVNGFEESQEHWKATKWKIFTAFINHVLQPKSYTLVNWHDYGKWLFVVDLSIANIGFNHSYVKLPEGTMFEPSHPSPSSPSSWESGTRYVRLKAEPHVAVAPHGDVLLLGLIGVPWTKTEQRRIKADQQSKLLDISCSICCWCVCMTVWP